LKRRAATVARAHKAAGLADPCRSKAVRLVLRTMAREVGTQQRLAGFNQRDADRHFHEVESDHPERAVVICGGDCRGPGTLHSTATRGAGHTAAPGAAETVAWAFSGHIGAMMRKQAPFDAAVMQKNAQRVRELAEMLPEAFQYDTRKFQVKTRATDTIWTSQGDFANKADELRKAAVALEDAARSGDQKKPLLRLLWSARLAPGPTTPTGSPEAQWTGACARGGVCGYPVFAPPL